MKQSVRKMGSWRKPKAPLYLSTLFRDRHPRLLGVVGVELYLSGRFLNLVRLLPFPSGEADGLSVIISHSTIENRPFIDDQSAHSGLSFQVAACQQFQPLFDVNLPRTACNDGVLSG